MNNLDRLPSNIVRYSRYYKLLELISNYIKESTKAINDFVTTIQPISLLDNQTSIDVFKMLAVKSGVALKWLPLIKEQDTDETRRQLYKQLYKLALQGKAAAVTSRSDYASLQDIVNSASNDIKSITVNNSQSSNMAIRVEVQLQNDAVQNLNDNYLLHYLIPEITGLSVETAITLAQTLRAQLITPNDTQETSATLSNKWSGVVPNTTKEVATTDTGYWVQEFN